MPDLHTLPHALALRGDIVTPPLEAVARRARRTRRRRTTKKVAFLLVVALLTPTVADWVADGERSSHVRLVDSTITPLPPTETMTFGSPALGPALPKPPPAPAPAPTFKAMATKTAAPPPARPSCKAGENGGHTDRGVTATRIRVAMAETLEFPMRYDTVDAANTVERLFEEVNRQGGICGRLIDFLLPNAVWGPLPWAPDADVFASIAGPQDPTIDEVLAGRLLDLVRMPLVGTSGLTSVHYSSAWAWPMGMMAAGLTRLALRHAVEHEQHDSIALVYDPNDRVGRDAAAAFDRYTQGRSDLKTYVHSVSTPSAPVERAKFEFECTTRRCDLVLLALSPKTAEKWLQALPKTGPAVALVGGDVPRGFWESCPSWEHWSAEACESLRLWSTEPATVDPSLPTLLSRCDEIAPDRRTIAVAGTCILLDALRQLGPTLTRQRLRGALDDITSRAGLVPPFVDGRRNPDGTKRAHGLRPVYDEYETYRGLMDDGTGWWTDSHPN